MHNFAPQPTPAEVAEWNQWHAYFTPTPVNQQLVQSIEFLQPRRVVDLGAAAGGMGMACAQTWPESLRLAVEARASERRHLERHFQHVVVDTLASAMASVRAFGPDLVICNPPFPHALEWILFALSLRCWIFFLLRASFGDDAEVYDFLEVNPPHAELGIGGRPNMRPDRSLSLAGNEQHGDWGAHKWLAWGPRRRVLPWTPRQPLPRLPQNLLHWTERPGTEPEPPPRLDDYLLIDARPLLLDGGRLG